MKKVLSAILPAAWLIFPALLTLQACGSPSAVEFDAPVALSGEALPDYTEYGYNTAGATLTTTYEKQELNHLWLIYSPPCAYITRQDDNTFTFSMNGERMPYRETVELSFTFQAQLRDTLADLRTLANTQYSTQKNNLSAHVSSSSISLLQELQVNSASLSFNRSRLIYTAPDNKQRGVSLSGTFEIAGVTDDVSVKISSGRFDILFSGHNGTSFSNGIRR